MTIRSPSLSVSGLRVVAHYELFGPAANARSRAEAIANEQTVEFPGDLIGDDDIRRYVMGRVESLEEMGADRCLAAVSYAVETTGFELPQLLNVLFGNCSLFPELRLLRVELPDALLDRFKGPRFGARGVRELVGAQGRPLLATALKPMGLDCRSLAEMAGTLARAGIDLIKDDHGLADQSFARYAERVRACAAAIQEANVATGLRALYLPSINAPAGEIEARARLAREAGAGGLLMMPGLTGFDSMRHLADDGSLALPVMAHPAFLGAFVVNDRTGIEHGTLFGTLTRLAGADMSVFPSYGGRFTFSPEACRSIADACRAPLGLLPPILPVPAGGMRLDRIEELAAFYGPETVLLVGGNLHNGELFENAKRMRAAVETNAQ